MSGYKRVNYYELCRLCASNQAKEKTHIFQEEGRKMQLLLKIQSCLPLQICEHDSLPKVVCSQCIEGLEAYYTFHQTCMASESMLSSYFTNFRHTDDFKISGKVYIKDTTKPTQNSATDPVTSSSLQSVGATPSIPVQTQPVYTLQLPQIIHCTAQSSKAVNLIGGGPRNSNKKGTSVTNCAVQTHHNLQQILPVNIYPCSANMKTSQINNSTLKTVHQKVSTAKPVQPTNTPSIASDKPSPSAAAQHQTNVLISKSLNNQSHSQLQQQMMDLDAIIDASIDAKLPANDSTKPLHKCEYCDKVFKRREHLYQHSKLHSGKRPFGCEYCDKTFMRKEHLLRHLTAHSGEKKFRCDICSKSFSRNDNLNKHRKTHEKQGSYTCEICQKQFIMKHYYQQHKYMHEEPPHTVLRSGLLCK